MYVSMYLGFIECIRKNLPTGFPLTPKQTFLRQKINPKRPTSMV